MNRILVYGMTNNLGGIESYLMNEFSLLDPEKAVFDFVVDFPEMSYSEKAEKMGSFIYFIPAKGKKLFSHWVSFYKILKAHPEYKKIYFNVLDAGAAFTMLIPWLMRRKIIVHSHSSNTEKVKLHFLCRPFLNIFAEKRLACSLVASRYMFGEKKADLIPNAIDCSKYLYNKNKRAAMRSSLGIDEHQPVLCFVGRLSREKNIPFMLDVLKETAKIRNDALLVIAGDGNDKDEIIQYAEKTGVAQRLMFLGRRNDVPDILQAADVFLMTSFYEGLSVVAIEAQAAGLPCVFSDGMSEETKINPNVCFVSLSESVENWAAKTLDMANEKRMTDQTLLQKAGYDLSCPNDIQKKLLQYFYES